MIRDARRGSRPIALMLALVTAPVAAVAGGAPMLTIESASPGSAEARDGAAFVVRATQCGGSLSAPVTARAEGVVAGERRSVDVPLVRSADGAWLVKRSWPTEGSWALVISVESKGRVVLLARPGQGRIVTRVLHRNPTREEIDRALRGDLTEA